MIRPSSWIARRITLVLAATLVPSLPGAGWAQPAKQLAPSAAAKEGDEEVQEKFIWGLLIQYAVSKLSSQVFDIFIKWLTPKLSGGALGLAERISVLMPRDAGVEFASRDAGTEPVSVRQGPPAEVVVGAPDKPLQVDGDQANYEGIHVAIMVDQGDGTVRFRPVSEGFRTGERFKLRLVSTFGGAMSIDNINPRGERRQIYPPRADLVALVPKSKEVLLPFAPDQFFQFTGNTGREQLVLRVADQRARADSASANKVFRQDMKYGSNFLQEVGKGRYAAFEQPIEIDHSGR
ncbi:MAG TPA: hypothetical protein VEB41_09870 [Burkholderiales bacterium]|nr:hypothetical protein [Burkholderiales bacterium]